MKSIVVALSIRALAALVVGALALLAHAADPVQVRIGIANASSDVGLFLADRKGYFRREGLAVSFVPFDSGARMVAPLGAGQLDVGAGSPAAGLYNAVARGIRIKIVADKGSTPPGHGFQPLLVRKDLVDSGRFRTLKDLKGMKIAGSAPGSASTSTLNEALKSVGLKYTDVDRLFLAFPQHLVAMQNKAIDASLTTEPTATAIVKRGLAVRVKGDDEIYPDHQLAVILFSGAFAKNGDAARRFMRAYLRAVRDYNDALVGGHITGPGSDDVVAALVEHTAIKDPAVHREITAQGCNPDGHLNLASLANDLAFFKEQGLIEGNVTVEQAVDASFVEAALKDLGPYRRKAAK